MKQLKQRTYLHFDSPLTEDERKIFDPDEAVVARHNFLPLVGFAKMARKVDFSTFPWTVEPKTRDIRYASHRDAAVYARYAERLGDLYEAKLRTLDLGSCVLAYRSEIGFNVTFSNDLFGEIRKKGDCQVLCADISGFFDNLAHDALKARVMALLQCKRLPGDWHNVFSSVTRYNCVDEKDFRPVLGAPKGGRLCEIVTFRAKVKPLVICNRSGKGVPQGTPISGLLANIYLIEVDERIRQLVEGLGGSYRRYSDDICLVLPPGADPDAVLDQLTRWLADIGLEPKSSKTTRTTFARGPGSTLTWTGDRLQYLGFEFDGAKVTIRPQTVRNYYARMKRSIRRTVMDAKAKGVEPAEIHKRVLMRNFTHAGRRNFVSYARRAAEIMKAPSIRKQVARHKEIFDQYFGRMVGKVYF